MVLSGKSHIVLPSTSGGLSDFLLQIVMVHYVMSLGESPLAANDVQLFVNGAHALGNLSSLAQKYRHPSVPYRVHPFDPEPTPRPRPGPSGRRRLMALISPSCAYGTTL